VRGEVCIIKAASSRNVFNDMIGENGPITYLNCVNYYQGTDFDDLIISLK